MAAFHCIALLRGINVGGKNIIRMADLKICFESMGLKNVETYIQSGNVLFSTTEKDKTKLTKKTETVLSERFNYKSRVVIITYRQLNKVINECPTGFGKDANKLFERKIDHNLTKQITIDIVKELRRG